MTLALNIMSDDELVKYPQPQDQESFGSLQTSAGHLPLKAMQVQAKISGLISQVSLRQTFVNTLDEPMEATYIFPLPPGAAVTKFRMEVNGRIVDGVVKERGQARREYTQAIESGHRAAITEEERPGVFTMRVGNIMPGEAPTIWLIMTGPLPYDEGEATFRFPLVVAPRYIPGTPLPGASVGDGVAADTDATPDASRISPPVLLPGYPNPVRLQMSVWLDPQGMGLSDLRSSLHAVESREEGGQRAIELQPGERLNRDFILRFRLGEDQIRTGLALNEDDDEPGGGTFAMTLVPPVSLSRSTKPRDVVFVLDRSGSMGGWKMVAARRAVARMVDTLRDKDRFSVIAFDTRIERPPQAADGELMQANDRNRFAAVEFLSGLGARGGTEMATPLRWAADRLAGGYEDRERVLVLVTDGQVGNEDQILRELAPRLKNVRIFTLGIDRAVNEGFLKRLADVGGGLCELVESEDRLDEVMDKVHRRIGTPVLTELSLVPTGLELVADSVVPKRLPDLFAGAPLFIMGRYRGASEGSLTIRGKDAQGQAFEQTIYGRPSDNRAIASLWARAQLRALEDQFVLGRDRNLEKEITEISIRYQVLCRFTAFLAVDREETVNPGGKQHKVTQPVESPDGWAMLGAKDSLRRSGKKNKAKRRAGPSGMSAVPSARGQAAPPASMAPPAPMNRPAPQSTPRMEERSKARASMDMMEMEADMGASEEQFRSIAIDDEHLVGPTDLLSQGSGGGAFGAPADLPDGPPPPQKRPVKPSPAGPGGSASVDRLRQQAESMVQRMNEESAHPQNVSSQIATLSVISAQLTSLVRGLKSAGTRAEVLKLSALSEALKALLAKAQPSKEETQRVWDDCLKALREFSAGARSAEFWR